MLTDIISSTPEFLMLVKEMEKNSFPKALLLINKDNEYLKHFARAVAMLILDGRYDKSAENGQKVLSNSHPDVKTYPQGEKLLVADSEAVVEESFIRPIFANKKVFIINSIDNSMDSAQNKLLKVVEEPSNNVYIIITCTNVNLVLPTIRSRCNKVELGRLEADKIMSLLPKLSEDEASLVLQVSDGQIGKAVALSKMKNFMQLCEDVLCVFTKLKKSNEVLACAKKLNSYKDCTALILQLMAFIIEDMLKIKSGQEGIVRLKGFLNNLKGVSGDYTVRALCEIAGLINKVEKEKIFNVNMTLAIENLLLGILEVKYLCK